MSFLNELGREFKEILVEERSTSQGKGTGLLLGNPSVGVGRWLMKMFGSESAETTIDAKVALGITTVWRAIQILGQTLGAADLAVYEIKENGDKVIAEDHVFHRLINRSPSPFYTSLIWRETSMVHCCLEGNAFSLIDRPAGSMEDIKNIHLLDPHAVDNVFVDPVKKTVMYDIKGINRLVPSRDIIHIPAMSFDGFVGYSPLEIHKNTLSIDDNSIKYLKNFYKNGGFISGFLSASGPLSEQAKKNLEDSWRSKYGGADNAGLIPVLEQGMKFEPVKMSPTQAGLTETKDKLTEDVARIFGIPLHMLQSLDRATHTNIEHLDIQFVKHTMLPWFRRWEAELNRKLFPKGGKYFVKFDLTDLKRGDIETMGEFYVKMFNIGALNRNEIRGFINMNSIPDGEKYFIQGNNLIPVEAAIKQAMEKEPGEEADIQTPLEK